jgi:protein-tyrosine phosphatase
VTDREHPLFRIERNQPGVLSTMPAPAGGALLKGNIESLVARGVTGIVSLLPPTELKHLGLNDEAVVAAANGLDFWHLPIGDFGVPDTHEVLQLVKQLVAALAQGQSVAIHCRMGIGRASTIAALVLRQEGVSASDAFARISTARGLPVPETAQQRAYVEAWPGLADSGTTDSGTTNSGSTDSGSV